MIVFDDKALQKKFEDTVQMIEEYRQVISKKVDMTNPADILSQLGELSNVAALGAQCEAVMEFLNDKNAMKKLSILDMESRGASEKKIIMSSEIGGTNFHLTLIRLLIKECHYNSDRLRTALSYLKKEMDSL